MVHKFYNSDNIKTVFLSPYCRIVDDAEEHISVVNTITNQKVAFVGDKDALDSFRKNFKLNIGVKYDNLSSYFESFHNCDSNTWVDLIQGGFLE